MSTMQRRWLIALAVLAAGTVAAALAFQLALRRLHSGIQAALGPHATLAAVSLGWTGVELRGLRVRASPGAQHRWPAADELSAERVRMVPALASLWRSGWHVHSVTVEGAKLSLLRTKDGKLRLLPSRLLRRQRGGWTWRGRRAAPHPPGVPRQAVLAALSRDGRIELAFTLEGRLDDPKFSVNELFAARFAVGLAEKLGVSLGGVVEGLGSVIKGLFGR